jgi:hypothetical protein
VWWWAHDARKPSHGLSSSPFSQLATLIEVTNYHKNSLLI